ncbi:MAG: putative fluoride ion transporter CrcB [Planctomycetota bacterium]|nr:MAG: putative fluoride ion transporter CrcB [Planctomycetota bacterium]
MTKLLAVGLGGLCGAIARYGLSGWVHRWYAGPFPLGTLLVNLLGCLSIGVLMALLERGHGIGPHARLFLGVGLLGAFTTFSTFGYETVELMRERAWELALYNAAGSVVLGLLAVLLGGAAVRALLG